MRTKCNMRYLECGKVALKKFVKKFFDFCMKVLSIIKKEVNYGSVWPMFCNYMWQIKNAYNRYIPVKVYKSTQNEFDKVLLLVE